MTVSHYAKFVVAILVAGLYALGAALSDDVVTNAEWVAIGTAVIAAIGVYVVPNKDTTV